MLLRLSGIAILAISFTPAFLQTSPPETRVTFSPPATYALSGQPLGAALGDFNGDGKMDLAVVIAADSAGGDDGGVDILLGNGDGTFQPAQTINGGNNPLSIVAADFNRDGHEDLAVYDNGDASVSILLGNGDGSFQHAIKFENAGDGGAEIAAQDMNGDGQLDIILANAANESIDVILGNGDGSFQRAIHNGIGAVPGPFTMGPFTIGHFDGDKALDVAVVINTKESSETFGGQVELLRGNGDGTLASSGSTGIGGRSSSVSSGDVNRDGHSDVIVTPQANIFSGFSLELLTGNGNGQFGTPIDLDPYSAESSTSRHFSAVVGDFNNDGKLDVATAVVFLADDSASPVLRVFLGEGDGTFQDPQDLTLSPAAELLLEGDLNADGRADILVLNAESNSIMVLLSTTSGAASPDFEISATEPDPFGPGQSATSTIEVHAAGGFSDSVSLSCSVSPQVVGTPQCAVNPSSVEPGTPATLTITSSKAGGAITKISRYASGVYGFCWYVLGLIVALGMLTSRLGKLRFVRLGMSVLALSTFTLLFACAGARSGVDTAGSGGSGGNSSTPPANYSVKVEGTLGAIEPTTTVMISVE